MAQSLIALRVQAKKLGVPSYQAMSASELETAVKKLQAKPASTPAAEANGASTSRKTATKTAGKKSAGRKTAAKPEPTPAKVTKKSAGKTKTAGRKSAKATPATSTKKSGTAKRSPAGARKSTAAKSTVTRQGQAGRNIIDNSSIDWKAPSTVGESGGNREIIMKALRRFKGDVTKVKDYLDPQIAKMYPKSQTTGEKYDQAKRRSLLSWHVSRVKFDFVTSTNQHTKSKNRAAGSGVKKTGNARKAAPARKTKAAPRKASAGRSRASASKKASARKSTGRKTNKR